MNTQFNIVLLPEYSGRIKELEANYTIIEQIQIGIDNQTQKNHSLEERLIQFEQNNEIRIKKSWEDNKSYTNQQIQEDDRRTRGMDQFHPSRTGLTHFEHPVDRRDGFGSCLFVYMHFRFPVSEAGVHFLKRVHTHIFTLVA